MRLRQAIAGAGLLGAALLARPTPLQAQLVNLDDPCVEVMLSGYAAYPLRVGSWTDYESVLNGAAAVRQTSAELLQEIKALRAKATLGTLTAVELDRLRSYNRCLPWMRSLLDRLEGAMKTLGINTIGAGDDRRQPPVDRDKLRADVIRELAEMQRLIAEALRPR